MKNSITQADDREVLYQMIRENRMLMYSKPRRYFNRDEEKGSTFRFLFLVETIVFLLLMGAAGSAMAQSPSNNLQTLAAQQEKANIHNYATVYNSGKVFVSWTSRNEQEDCVYIVERSPDGQAFEAVGIKEGIGSDIELYYSWVDHTPPAGFAFYRVKKITKEGSQLYSSVSSIINQSTNFENYAKGTAPVK